MKLSPAKTAALSNILLTWRLLAPRTSVEMEQTRIRVLAQLPQIESEDPTDIERQVILALRDIETVRQPRKTRTRQATKT